MKNITIDQFNPGPHHKIVIDHITKNRFSIILNSDQTGITRSYAMFLLEYLLDNPGKKAVISSNNKQMIMEVSNILVELFDQLPNKIMRYNRTKDDDFQVSQQVEILLNNSKVLEFSNGSSLYSYVAHKNTNIPVDVDCFILMDMADIINSEVKGLYTDMFPKISAKSDGRMIINSSPNGANLFYEIFYKAELPKNHSERNSFEPLRLYYWQVPGRDGKWVKDQIEKFGDDLFNKRYNLCFNSNSTPGLWFPPHKQLPPEVIGYDITFKFRNSEA